MSKALFANQRETNLASTIALVEEVLAARGASSAVIDPTAPPSGGAARAGSLASGDSSTLRAWQIGKDARLALINRSEFTHIRVQDVVMTLDDKVDRPALHAELLDHNAHLCGAAFATDGDRILLVTERTTLDLDKSEVQELIARVINYAGQHAQVLISRYGGRHGS